MMALTIAAARAGGGQGIVFADTVHDFGTVEARLGEITAYFEFQNCSDSTMMILGAMTQCGCMVPQYPHEPIAPGQRGTVRVTYRIITQPPGPFEKRIVLRTTHGADPIIRLYVKGNSTR